MIPITLQRKEAMNINRIA